LFNFGNVPYPEALSGAAAVLPVDLPLPLLSLVFAQDGDGNYDGSAYDLFLVKNGLPRRPRPAESVRAYSHRLRRLLRRLTNPQFVTEARMAHSSSTTIRSTSARTS
jgi:hypothetical protein